MRRKQEYLNYTFKRGYPNNLIDKTLSEVKFSDRKKALKDNTRVQKEILPFVTQYNPSVPNLKHILMEKWHVIESQPKLQEMFKEPPIISYERHFIKRYTGYSKTVVNLFNTTCR